MTVAICITLKWCEPGLVELQKRTREDEHAPGQQLTLYRAQVPRECRHLSLHLNSRAPAHTKIEVQLIASASAATTIYGNGTGTLRVVCTCIDWPPLHVFVCSRSAVQCSK